MTGNDYTGHETERLGALGRASFTRPPAAHTFPSLRNARAYGPRFGKGEAFEDGDPVLRFKRGVPELVNKAYLLNRRSGWTRRAIQRFLGEPDIRRENKWGIWDNCVVQECLYSGARVDAVERSPEFLAWLVKRNTSQARPKRRPEGEPAYGFVRGIPDLAKPVYHALNRRDRQIIRLLFVKGLRQRTVGERLSVSQQTVSRVRLAFLDKMQ